MGLLKLNRDPAPRQVRWFGSLWLPAFWLLVGVLYWRRTGAPLGVAAAGAAAALTLAVAWVAPRVMRLVFVGWMYATFPLGWVISHVLLGFVYYVAFTLVALGFKLTGRDPMRRRLDRSAATYWVARAQREDASSYFRQF